MKKKGGKAVQTTANLLLITKIYSLGGGKMKTFGTMGQFLIPDGTVNKFSQESASKRVNNSEKPFKDFNKSEIEDLLLKGIGILI